MVSFGGRFESLVDNLSEPVDTIGQITEMELLNKLLTMLKGIRIIPFLAKGSLYP